MKNKTVDRRKSRRNEEGRNSEEILDRIVARRDGDGTG